MLTSGGCKSLTKVSLTSNSIQSLVRQWEWWCKGRHSRGK